MNNQLFRIVFSTAILATLLLCVACPPGPTTNDTKATAPDNQVAVEDKTDSSKGEPVVACTEAAMLQEIKNDSKLSAQHTAGDFTISYDSSTKVLTVKGKVRGKQALKRFENKLGSFQKEDCLRRTEYEGATTGTSFIWGLCEDCECNGVCSACPCEGSSSTPTPTPTP